MGVQNVLVLPLFQKKNLVFVVSGHEIVVAEISLLAAYLRQDPAALQLIHKRLAHSLFCRIQHI